MEATDGERRKGTRLGRHQFVNGGEGGRHGCVDGKTAIFFLGRAI